MSIQEIVAIITGVLITLAFVKLLVNGRSQQRHLGPVNANLAPGQPPAQNPNPNPQPGQRFVYKPWMGMAGGAAAVATLIGLIIVFWTPIAASVGAPRWEYAVLFAALVVLVLAAVFPAARNAIGALPRPLVILVLILLLVMFRNTLLALFPLDTQVTLLVAQRRIMDNLFLVLMVGAFALLFISRRAAVAAGALAVLLFFLSTDNLGLTRADKVHAWITTPSSVRTPIPAVASLPPNTSRSCSGSLKSVSLGQSNMEINPSGCFMYWRVETGRVILSGPVAQKEVGPEGGNFDGLTFYKARAATGTAQLRYLNCAAPKRDMSKVDCS